MTAPVSKALFGVPSVAPGIGITEAIHRASLVMKSDKVSFDATSPAALFDLGANVLILGAYVQVTTAFDASDSASQASLTVTVPNDTGGTDTIIDEMEMPATGVFLATGCAFTAASGGQVLATLTPGTTTAGEFYVYLEYVPLGETL